MHMYVRGKYHSLTDHCIPKMTMLMELKCCMVVLPKLYMCCKAGVLTKSYYKGFKKKNYF